MSSCSFRIAYSILNRKMLLLCISVLAFLYVQSSYGQQVYGEVQHDNCPIENCNVVVRNVVDSAFVSGATTDKSGFFAIDKMDAGSYFLEVSCVGYERQRVSFNVSSDQPVSLQIDLPLNEKFLNEVTVTASHRIWKRTNSSLVMKVEGTPLADMVSAIDILAYIPGIVVDNSAIKLIGKDNVLILIDNRAVSSFSEVENLSVNSIKTVAIERNAGVRYDSKYKSVLRISTKKRNSNAVEISQRTKVGRKVSNTENVNFCLGSTDCILRQLEKTTE